MATLEGLAGESDVAEDAELMANILQGVGDGGANGSGLPLPGWASPGVVDA